MARVAPIRNIDDPRWVRAISHPLRMRLLAALEHEATSPKTLADRLQVPIGTVAYHVKTLHDLGLLELDHTRQRRGAVEHYYRAVEHPRFTDEAWSRLDVVSKQRVLAAVLTQAHEDAVRAAAAGGFDAADAHFTRTPLRLDAAGWTELAEASKRWLDEAARIQDESDERIRDGGGAELAAELVVLLFESAEEGAPGRSPQPARSTGSSI
jgi:DNA-binding transcriptional ArsR family regulator